MLPRLALSPRVVRFASGLAAALTCAVGVYVLGRTLDESYPVREWLTWRLAPVWGYALLFNVAAVTGGAFLLRRLLGDRPLPALERLLQSMMLGLTSFVLLLYVAGFVGLLKPWLAVAMPLLFLVVGERDGRALLEELFAWRAALPAPKPVERVLGSLAIVFGASCLVFLYLEALDVSAVNFDATWYHFPIAQDYARVGRIIAFPGENHRAFPHLTSMVHTWALLVPGLPFLPQHWMLSLHLEFTIVVWRLVGAAALARWLIGGRDVRGLWAGFFLFPSVFVYDQAIGGSADHFLGFFAVPAVLAAARAFKRFDLRWCVLVGVALGGHMLVKYQAAYLIAGVSVAALVSLLVIGLRRFVPVRFGGVPEGDPSYRALLKGVGALALSAALVSSPHFIKNAVFYNNPAYPFAQRIFKSTYPPRVSSYYEQKPAKGGAFPPKYSGLRRQVWALGKVFDYSLTTGNRNLTRHRPYMGALFSLLLPCALFLPRRRRFVFTAGIAAIAVMVWANTAANDRYMLGFYDLCIGSALGLMVSVWELGVVARLGLVPLVGLQLIWGGDSMLFYGRKQLEATLDLIGDGYAGRYDSSRMSSKVLQQRITEATPKNAVILSRNYKGLLGLNRLVLSDIDANQDYVRYSHLEDPRAFYDLLTSRGVTHLLFPRGDRRPGTWNNVILFAEIFRRGPHQERFGKLWLSELPKQAPPRIQPYLVAVSGFKEYRDGVYSLAQLDIDYRDPGGYVERPAPLRKLPASGDQASLDDISALAICRGRMPGGYAKEQLSAFESVESLDGCENYLRRLP
jgi:hypothetical protein